MVIGIFLITLKDSYAYYGGSNELEIVNAKIGKLKPTIDKVYIEEENQQYTNNQNPSVTIEWPDDNITEYCVTTDGTCSAFTQLSDTNSKSVTVPIALNGDGLKTVNAFIKNKYGYTSLAVQSSITLDTIPPTISSLSTTEITETSIKVNVAGSDANGIKQYCYSTSNSNYTCTDSNAHAFNNLNSGQQYTLYIYLTDNAGNSSAPTQEQFTTISKSAKDVVVATSKSLETEEAMQARNATITSGTKDDLRRFVGTYTTVNDNFICFGTNDQNICKQNMDTYMYRIIGVDSHDRLKLIKATKVKKNSQSTFGWYINYSSNITWQNSDLYKGLNGQSPNTGDTSTCNQCFGNGSEYSYMSQDQWTNLIVKPDKWYIGDSTDNTNPSLFQKERGSNITNGDKIGLMYLSDYLYANNGNANTNNWLFIANGLNNQNNTGSGSTKPSEREEWTMTRCGKIGYGACSAWYVNSNGTVSYAVLTFPTAVRPVFYLKSTTRISNGNGTIGNPYMIAP